MEARVEPRKSRAEDARRLEERIAQCQNLTFGVDESILDKVRSLAPDGWTYAWILSSIYNEPNDRIKVQKARGWTAVPADRHPELFFNDTIDGSRSQNGIIEHKGVILCERPTVICEREAEAYRQKTMKFQNTIPDANRYMGDPLMPGRFQNDKGQFVNNPDLVRTNLATPGRY